MYHGSVRAAESFKNRSIRLKNKTKEKKDEMKKVILEKLDRYL